ncbi:iron-sulfur cluster assembly scaffold protein [Chloroflexota bacterium]
MTTAWEEFQERLIEKMKEIYSEAVVDHSMNPRNLGVPDKADGHAVIKGPCGDTMGIWLKVKDDIILEANFTTDGCGTSIASGSMITELAKGKKLVDAIQIGQQDVLGALGGLPEDHEHCALLAANTLKEAVQNCIKLRNEPWEKAYEKH